MNEKKLVITTIISFISGGITYIILAAISGNSILFLHSYPQVKNYITLLAAKAENQSTNTAIVTKIIDGDSIKANINGQVKNIRLACIDAMESNAPMGKQSKAVLKSLIPIGTTIQLKIVQVDQYQRLVAEIYKNKELINKKMLEAGAAIIYPRYLNNCKGNREKLEAAQQKAQNEKVGFWGLPINQQINPWNWRRKK
ncbi:MAG: thermonuclease family protein [Trichodesmium sp. St16_bin4-tuft]|nr:thermonuclease family protein [Trichodesmium sp. St16_bin4-tuft]